MQVSPIDIETWRARSGSINCEVLKFQEELLNYEEESLYPRPVGLSKTEPLAQAPANKSLFTKGFVQGQTDLDKEISIATNNLRNLNEGTLVKKVSAKEKFFNSLPDSDSRNNNQKNDNDSISLSRRERDNLAYADKQIEEWEKDEIQQKEAKAEELLAEYEKGMRETEGTKDPVLAQLDLPRKKSVHFEGVSICLSEVGSNAILPTDSLELTPLVAKVCWVVKRFWIGFSFWCQPNSIYLTNFCYPLNTNTLPSPIV